MSLNSAEKSTLIPGRRRTQREENDIPILTIISHPNPERIGEVALLLGLARGKEVELSRLAPAFKHPGATFGQGLEDPFISREPIGLRPAGANSLVLDPGKSKTALAVGNQNISAPYSISLTDLVHGVVLVLGERVVLLLHSGPAQIKRDRNAHGLVGASKQIVFLRQELDRVGDLTTPVLLRGPSGTGKELAAQAIHKASGLRGDFVTVNLAALPSSLAASELFGAVKGSFTGAQRHQMGYFRMAQGGTLFLDEIGEASPDIQVMLLRALESGEISPVGAQKPIHIETRLIAATDADLEAKMAEDSFKTPLFHRLAGYEINLPPLVDRLEDFGRLFMYFARKEMDGIGRSTLLRPRGPNEEPWLPADLVVHLLEFAWPGNVRQLRNVVRQLVIGCRGEESLHMVPKLQQILDRAPAGQTKVPDQETAPALKRKPADVDDEEVVAALKGCQWDVKAAALELGISRAALYLLIDKIPGLVKATDLSSEQIQAGKSRHANNLEALADDLGVSIRALKRRMTQLGIHH